MTYPFLICDFKDVGIVKEIKVPHDIDMQQRLL